MNTLSSQPQPTTMITLCQDYSTMGLDVCFSISNHYMVRDAIRKGYSFAELLKALDDVRPLDNIIRKE
jgi:hypothetical protein